MLTFYGITNSCDPREFGQLYLNPTLFFFKQKAITTGPPSISYYFISSSRNEYSWKWAALWVYYAPRRCGEIADVPDKPAPQRSRFYSYNAHRGEQCFELSALEELFLMPAGGKKCFIFRDNPRWLCNRASFFFSLLLLVCFWLTEVMNVKPHRVCEISRNQNGQHQRSTSRAWQTNEVLILCRTKPLLPGEQRGSAAQTERQRPLDHHSRRTHLLAECHDRSFLSNERWEFHSTPHP